MAALQRRSILVEGVVREVSPVADPTTRTYTVKVTLKNPPAAIRLRHERRWPLKNGIRPGGRCFRSPFSLKKMARRRCGSSIRDQGSVALRPVTVARYETDTVIIASGLAKGDIVVTAGINTLREGQKVRLADAAAGGSDRQMKNFNLSRWALDHKSLVVYLMLVIALAGILNYRKLGREEDPPFTIKTMVVKTLWPGATTLETVKQVTDRIEKKLEELPNLDYLKSYTKPGESVVFVNLKDSTRAPRMSRTSGIRRARRSATSSRRCRRAFRGRSSTTSSATPTRSIFALTSDGFSHRELRDYAERVRAELLRRAGRRQDRPHRHPGREDLPRVLHPAARRHGARQLPS